MRKCFFSSLLFPALVLATEPLPKQSYISVPSHDAPPMMEGYSAPARVDVRSSWNLFFNSQWIFWIPKQQGLDFAISDQNSSNPSLQGKRLEPNFKFCHGWRFAFGGYSGIDHWDFLGEFTWLPTKVRTSMKSDTGGNLSMRWFPGAPRASSAKTRWNLELIQLDMELGRFSYLSKRLLIRPFIGTKLLIINQRYLVKADLSEYNNLRVSSVHQSDSWALGPKIGTQTQWNVGKGVKLRGKVAPALIYACTRAKSEIPDLSSPISINSSVSFPSFHLKDVGWELVPCLQTSLGFSWGFYFSHYRWHFEVFGDYDFQYISDQNTLRTLVDAGLNHIYGGKGSLMLHGFTFGTQFQF